MGFHGDKCLRSIVDYLSKKSKFFIETGTHKGHTFHYMANSYPNLECFGCEPAKGRFDIALRRTRPFEHATVFNETSQQFMKHLKNKYAYIFDGPILFWLDAHSTMFKWPLAQELKFFTVHTKSGYILIDDFKVPNQPQFRYNKYGKQRYTYQYIKPFINKKINHRIYFPKYKKEKKKQILTGWVLIQFGGACDRLDKVFSKTINHFEERVL